MFVRAIDLSGVAGLGLQDLIASGWANPASSPGSVLVGQPSVRRWFSHAISSGNSVALLAGFHSWNHRNLRAIGSANLEEHVERRVFDHLLHSRTQETHGDVVAAEHPFSLVLRRVPLDVGRQPGRWTIGLEEDSLLERRQLRPCFCWIFLSYVETQAARGQR